MKANINKFIPVSAALVTGLVLAAIFSSCSNGNANTQAEQEPGSFNGVTSQPLKPAPGKAMAAFAEGCFWHSEIIFESLQGVDSVINGYAGGKVKNPSYEDVSTGRTGHAESVLVYYDPKKISFPQLLNAFFLSHDATQVDEQLPDEGPQYRSVAFYSNQAEKNEIIASAVMAQKATTKKIATDMLPLTAFYKAEAHHQHYIADHPENPYVQSVSIPEFNEFKKVYKGPLKKTLN